MRRHVFHVHRAVAWIVVGATAVIAGCASSGVAPTTPPTSNQPVWSLVWQDEFTGPAGATVDSTTWSYDLGDGCSSGNCGWGNQEREYYRASTENAVLNGQGQLEIIARAAPAGLTCYYGPCGYTSAKLKTFGKRLAGPGRVEARIKLPRGQGLWPAFWMLGSSFPATPWPACGELDIMENHGSNLGSVSSAIHGPGYSGNTPFVHAVSSPTSFDADYHTFSIVWGGSGISFFVDGALHYVVARDEVGRRGNWVFDQPFFIILNLAVGGTFDGNPTSDAIFPATMLVDYVRVYART
ncbi:MAG: glycoside hydrolase family 16 protein [Gemmatimonadaceae bacterium]